MFGSIPKVRADNSSLEKKFWLLKNKLLPMVLTEMKFIKKTMSYLKVIGKIHNAD